MMPFMWLSGPPEERGLRTMDNRALRALVERTISEVLIYSLLKREPTIQQKLDWVTILYENTEWGSQDPFKAQKVDIEAQLKQMLGKS